ncbi:MAG: metallophosphoesterase [Thermoplasmata archaeon]|nr:metallophosphoesterase [Thermoplasmata archaeon]
MEKIEKAIEAMKKEPAFLKLHGNIMVAGDTHGDVVISKAIVKKFFEENYNALLFLGDYVDRAPDDVDSSIPNINFLLEMKTRHPDKIFLLKGNHEANYAIPCFPNEFEYEVKQSCPSLYELYVKAFMEMPLMALANNVYAAHGGFPRKNMSIDKNDVDAIEEITWSDVALSPVYRGAGFKFDKKMLAEFLNRINAKAFIRGHDYTMNGIIAYEACLTIFSSRRYENEGNGGILIAKINGMIDGIGDIKIERWRDGKWEIYEPAFIE